MKLTSCFETVRVTKGLEQFWREKRYGYCTVPRPDHGFLLVKKGTLTYSFQEQAFSASRGDLIFLPAASQYEAIFHTEAGAVETVLLNFELPDPGDLPRNPERILQHTPPALQEALLQTVKAFRADAPFLTKSRFYLFCHLLWEQGERDSAGENDLIRKAKVLMAEHPELSVEAVAQQLLVSPSGLRKKFKEATGVAPVAYRRRIRLERSAEMLLHSDLSVEEIARRCHFYDAAHFCREFKAGLGIAPGTYREKHGFHP